MSTKNDEESNKQDDINNIEHNNNNIEQNCDSTKIDPNNIAGLAQDKLIQKEASLSNNNDNNENNEDTEVKDSVKTEKKIPTKKKRNCNNKIWNYYSMNRVEPDQENYQNQSTSM